MRGVKDGDIVKTDDGYHARVLGSLGRQEWSIEPIESWAKSRRRVKSRQIVAIYRPLKRKV